MFWGITADNWALLWGAFIGAVISGGAAAGVATWVLKKTREDQASLAKTQLDEQRKDLEHQLKEQRQSLELQLKEQRAEASKAREIAAIADILAAAATINERYAERDSVMNVLFVAFESAVVRWQIELDHKEMAHEIQDWGTLFRKLADLARWEIAETQSDKYRQVLDTARHGLEEPLKAWPAADAAQRDDLFHVLVADRELAESSWA